MSKKLIGQKKLEKGITQIFSKAVGEYISMGLDADFWYDCITEEVHFSIIMSERGDRCFKKFFRKQYGIDLKTSVELFVMSVLHEIGHYYTYDDVTDDIFNYCKDEEERIQAELEINDTDEIYSRYFYLPDEIVANDWAAAWYKDHPKKFKKLIDKVQLLLNDFYTQNVDIDTYNGCE